ncbi:MAG: hypothetical protein Q8P22_06895 [Chloroflexota bacterium]|nr:hypothetical protein [Chloroflexota bacterium]
MEVGEAGAEEVGEEAVADLGGAAALVGIAAGELDEGVADAGQESEGSGEVAELGGVAALLEGIEVTLGGAGAGSFAASGHGSLLLTHNGFGTDKRMAGAKPRQRRAGLPLHEGGASTAPTGL